MPSRKRPPAAAAACRANLTGYYPFNCNHPCLGNRPSIACRSDDDAAEHHVAFFGALEIDGAGKFFMAVESAAGDAGDFLVVDDGFAVLDDRHHAPDERDVVGLPFRGLAWK